jgi:hypothetical protein
MKEFGEILAPFEALDEAWFERVVEEMPEEWQGAARAIGRHVREELAQRDRLIHRMREAADEAG